MAPTLPNGLRDRDLALSNVLKALRHHRGLTVAQVARRMGLHKRSYERFEAGEGSLKMERIFSFARATDSDPYALVVSVRLGASDFAVACADNKLATVLIAHGRDLFARHRQDIRHLQPQQLIEALRGALMQLDGDVETARTVAASWTARLEDPNDGET